MAINFPFFKFVATEWLTGDIALEDFEIQGLFINICALYWHRDGKINITELQKRLKSDKIELLKDRFLNIDKDGFISIKFLDEQLLNANHVSKVNSENGKKGAEAKRLKATAKRPLSKRKANLSKEEEEKEEEKEYIPPLSEFLEYAKSECQKVGKDFDKYSYSIKAKYEAWVEAKWKDGNGEKIKNWKTKFKNTLPYLKEFYQKEEVRYAGNGIGGVL